MEGMEHSFSIMGMWEAMTWAGKAVVIILALMSVWSLTIAIERLWRFQKAKRESLQLAKGVTPLLRDPEDEVRAIAAWALGEIESATALPALQAVRDDRSPEVRRAVRWAIGNIDDRR